MALQPEDKPLSQRFLELLPVAEKIRKGTKGVDFLVLCDDDEMKGYCSTDLEKRFKQVATDVIKAIQDFTPEEIAKYPPLVGMVIKTLVYVQPAVDSYRARMYQYATDWGSEVSPVGTWSNNLLDAIEDVIKVMPEDDIKRVFKSLPKEIINIRVERIYWKEVDRSDSYYRSVENILFYYVRNPSESS
ncbi:MAG: hypothetical protein P1Q69_12415 [Candidatus Thorarchaeota archaeon]|nr:hypothetical protein [Candidatus Thorarchaeota archaeon]